MDKAHFEQIKQYGAMLAIVGPDYQEMLSESNYLAS